MPTSATKNLWIEAAASNMSTEQKNNPLHGKTLEMILDHLVKYYGWKEMGLRI